MVTRFWILTLTPLVTLVSYLALVYVVLREAVSSRLQRVFAVYLLVMAIWSLSSALMRLDPAHIVLWNKATTGSVIVMALAFYTFVLVFLDEDLNRWLGLGIAVGIAFEVANMLGLLVDDIMLLQGGLVSFELTTGGYLMAGWSGLYLASAVFWLARAYRRTSNPVQRNRILYPLVGGVIVLVGGVSNLIDVLGTYPIDHAANLLNALLLAYAVLRYQLVDISLVFRKGLLYTIPTATIGVAYFLLITLATSLFHALTGLQIFFISLIVAALAAVAAQPLRDRAQLWIDRLFFREKYDASLMLQKLSGAAASILDLEKLTGMILDGITSTMHVRRAGFFLRQEGSSEFRLGAHRNLESRTHMRLRSDHPLVDWLSGHDNALAREQLDLFPPFKALWGDEMRDLDALEAELFVPLKAKGELVGVLALGPKLSEEPYSPDDQRTLTTLANQIATALENARLHEETRRRYRDLVLLNRIIAASATNQDMEPILHTVCHELASAFAIHQAQAAVLDGDGCGARLVTAYNPGEAATGNGEEASPPPVSDSSGDDRSWSTVKAIEAASDPVLQYILEYRTLVVVHHGQGGAQLSPVQDLMRRAGLRSLLALPLTVDGAVEGMLCLGARDPRVFSSQDIDLSLRVAEQVSGALARARLAETQQRLSTAVEQAAEAVMITDVEGAIAYVNPAFEQLCGYDRSEIIGRSPRQFLGGSGHSTLYGQLTDAMRKGCVQQGRVVNRKKSGEHYTVDAMVTPVRNQAQEIVNYVATMRDVTREVQLQEQFRQVQKMEALGRLAGGIAHDFNNLLTVIHLSTRMLERDLGPEDTLWPHVKRIEETGQRAAALTKQLLSFSRREIVEPQALDLNQLVEDMSGMLGRIIGENIEFSTVLARDLGPARLDPSQMEQVIMNLVVNARDAMPDGGRLQIETENVLLDTKFAEAHPDVEPGKYLMLVIRDTGVGMDEEVKSHLFEPFFTTKERGQGTGLGLSTVFGIVKQNQGHISVESKVDEGTTFRIYLPRVAANEADLLRAAESSELARTPPGTETILIVEDAADVRRLTVQTLRAYGYQVLAANDGLEALEVSNRYQGPIHLLLTDLVMPQMGGRDLVEALRPQRPDMQIMYMSAYADRPLVKQAMSDPLIAFLAKPFTVEKLTQKVRDTLERRK
jgi:PAS domain S-box-containing protein